MKVLLPIDGSESANVTLQWASQFLDKAKTQAFVLHVIEETADIRITENVIQKSQTLLQDAKLLLQNRGFNVGQAVELYGEPASTICKFIDTQEIHQVIMATNQRKGLSRDTLGSVSQAVFKECSAQVLLLEASEKPAFKISHPELVRLCQPQSTPVNILLPIDETEGSREALEWAGRFLDKSTTRFFLLHVIELDIGIEDSLRHFYESKRILDIARDFLKKQGFQKVDIESVIDEPVEGICSFAEEQNVDQIIIGSYGKGLSKALLGSVSKGVLKCARKPVFALKNHPSFSLDIVHSKDVVFSQSLEKWPVKILLPIDGSKDSQKTLEWAVGFLDRDKANLYLLYVIDYHPSLSQSLADFDEAVRILDNAKLWLGKQGFRVEDAQYVVDEVAKGICHYADEHGMDQIIIGSHGRTALTQFLIGSVSAKVFEKARQPVVLLKNGAKSTLKISHLEQIKIKH